MNEWVWIDLIKCYDLGLGEMTTLRAPTARFNESLWVPVLKTDNSAPLIIHSNVSSNDILAQLYFAKAIPSVPLSMSMSKSMSISMSPCIKATNYKKKFATYFSKNEGGQRLFGIFQKIIQFCRGILTLVYFAINTYKVTSAFQSHALKNTIRFGEWVVCFVAYLHPPYQK